MGLRYMSKKNSVSQNAQWRKSLRIGWGDSYKIVTCVPLMYLFLARVTILFESPPPTRGDFWHGTFREMKNFDLKYSKLNSHILKYRELAAIIYIIRICFKISILDFSQYFMGARQQIT